MGCDIHLFAEVLKRPKWWQVWKKKKWVNIHSVVKNPYFGDNDEPEFIKEQIYEERNYNLFCALAGVRAWEFEGGPNIISKPKGLPVDCSWEAIESSNNYGTDGHSHSWNTLEELEAFNWDEYGKTCDRFKEKVFSVLKSHSKNPKNVRIVYFFDN